MPGIVILANARWDTDGRGGNSSQQYAVAAMRMGWQVSYIQKDRINRRTPLEEMELGPSTAVMCDMPWVDFYFDLFMRLKELGCPAIYRIVDNWEMTKRRVEYREAREIEFIRAADAVFASNPLNIERFREVREDIHLLRNGVDLDVFWQWQGLPPGDLARGDPTVVFVTSFWSPEWLDWEGMRAAAEARPEMALNIIGENERAEIAEGLPSNIHFLGGRTWKSLPSYFWNCDVGLVAYDAEGTKYNNPIKVLEYLACARPVVAPPNPSLAGYPYLFTYERPDQLAEKIRAAAGAKVDHGSLYGTLQGHTWTARLVEMTRHLNEATRERPQPREAAHKTLEELLGG